MMGKSKSQIIAETFVQKATECGWKWDVRDNIVTITKQFTPNENSEFCKADSEYAFILGEIPMTQEGSMWGTDGGGVGALSAMKTGVFTMNKSGCSKRVLAVLISMK